MVLWIVGVWGIFQNIGYAASNVMGKICQGQKFIFNYFVKNKTWHLLKKIKNSLSLMVCTLKTLTLNC